MWREAAVKDIEAQDCIITESASLFLHLVCEKVVGRKRKRGRVIHRDRYIDRKID
jgi:hypothetical protein